MIWRCAVLDEQGRPQSDTEQGSLRITDGRDVQKNADPGQADYGNLYSGNTGLS